MKSVFELLHREEIHRYREDRFYRIERFLSNAFSSPTHWPEWNQCISKYFKTDFCYYVLLEKNEVVAVCPVHRLKENMLFVDYTGPKHFLIPYGGWIFTRDYNFDIANFPVSAHTACIGFTLPLLDEFHVRYRGNRIDNRVTLIVDLSRTETEIWEKSISSKRKNMIRKAVKNGIEVEMDDKSDLDPFYSILSNANSRYGLPTYERDFFVDLFQSAKNISFDIFWAKQNNSNLAGLVLAKDKNYAIYWLGLMVEGSPNTGQGELLQWEAIKHAKEAGCRYYDLCSIEKELLPHIYDFKRDFSKNELPFLAFSSRPFSYKLRSRIALWI